MKTNDVASKKATVPLSCLLSASMATATIPLKTATLLAIAPKVVISIVSIKVGSLGFLMSNTSIVAALAFTLNIR